MAEDFKWLASVDDQCKFLINSEPTIWANAVRDSPRFLVKRAVLMAQQYKEPSPTEFIPPVVVCPSRRALGVVVVAPDGVIPLVTYGPEYGFCRVAGMYLCKRCDFSHGAANSFAVHLLQQHGASRMSSRYAHDGYCPICLAVFLPVRRTSFIFRAEAVKGLAHASSTLWLAKNL